MLDPGPDHRGGERIPAGGERGTDGRGDGECGSEEGGGVSVGEDAAITLTEQGQRDGSAPAERGGINGIGFFARGHQVVKREPVGVGGCRRRVGREHFFDVVHPMPELDQAAASRDEERIGVNWPLAPGVGPLVLVCAGAGIGSAGDVAPEDGAAPMIARDLVHRGLGVDGHRGGAGRLAIGFVPLEHLAELHAVMGVIHVAAAYQREMGISDVEAMADIDWGRAGH